MKQKTISRDPLGILETTSEVLKSARFVFVSEKNIKKTARFVEQRLERGLGRMGEGFHAAGSFAANAQLTFVEDAVNFCFWSDLGIPRWQIEFPAEEYTEGGYFAMQKCFERALAEGVPILDAAYLSEMTPAQAKNLFRSSNEHEIPLLEERRNILRETGRVLLQKYRGRFVEVLEKSGGDAIGLVKLVVSDFPSFRDIANLEGKEILFLKRAQIAANDISYLSAEDERANLNNLDQLTIFADYKIPQIMREFGVVSYAEELAAKIDSGKQIESGSREEIEIRSASVWGCELIRVELEGKYTAAQIDNTLWLLSQNKKNMRTYHRTRTIFY